MLFMIWKCKSTENNDAFCSSAAHNGRLGAFAGANVPLFQLDFRIDKVAPNQVNLASLLIQWSKAIKNL